MKKALSLLLAIMLLAGLAFGCVKTETRAITACVGSDPKSIDPTLNNSVDGAIYIIHTFEGLTKLDKQGKVVAGVAKSWTMSEDGKVFTFKLRDSKWSDGQPVKAADFVYSWKRAVNPKTAAEYAYQMSYIKNAATISGTAVEDFKAEQLDTLGVKAIDDKTLEVTLENPCAYFLELTAFPTYFPLREDVVEGNDQWTFVPETYIGNGPYVLKAWDKGSKITMAKNPQYYAKNTIVAQNLEFLLMEDQNAMLAAYKNGELLFSDDMPTDEIEKLKASGDLQIKGNLGTYFYVFNTTKAPFDNVKVRKALSLAVDRQYLVEKVAMGNQLPAGAYVPTNLPDVKAGSDFRTVGKDYYNPTTAGYAANVATAKTLLTEAGYNDTNKFPQIELKYNTSDGHKKIAEYIASEWKKNLNIDVILVNEDWAVFQQDRTDGNFEVARHGWLGDYVDPMTFLEMWTSTSGQNDCKWKSSAFDDYVKTAKEKSDRTIRMEAMHKAEDLLMGDMPIMPLYFYTDLELISPKLEGMVQSALGFKYFMYCSIKD